MKCDHKETLCSVLILEFVKGLFAWYYHLSWLDFKIFQFFCLEARPPVKDAMIHDAPLRGARPSALDQDRSSWFPDYSCLLYPWPHFSSTPNEQRGSIRFRAHFCEKSLMNFAPVVWCQEAMLEAGDGLHYHLLLLVRPEKISRGPSIASILGAICPAKARREANLKSQRCTRCSNDLSAA